MASILTINKNRTHHLKALIEGVNRNSILADEIIIVEMSDNIEKLVSQKIPLKIIPHHSDKLPLAKARNLAAKMATSEKLLFLDVDCIPAHNFVSKMCHYLYKHPQGLISCEVIYLPPNAINYGNIENWTQEQLNDLGTPHPDRSFPITGYRYETNAGLFWSLAFAVNKDIFKKIGGFSEEYIGYGAEDTDFSFKAKEKSINHLLISGTKVFHQYHTSSDPPYQHFNDITRNAQIFYSKWHFWPMEGWLEKFAKEGYIIWNPNSTNIEIIHKP